jgi:hypothetical protein
MTSWPIPLVLASLGAAVVLLAPTERTLGEGIRWVYVHVGLVWAGTVALGVAAAGGLAALATGRMAIARWVRATWGAGLLAFGCGIAFSMVAARVNWGAVALNEPRMAASLRFVAIAVIVHVLAGWIARPRVTGLLAATTFALLVWDVGGAQLVMHPRDPIRSATSAPIQWTFAASFAIAGGLTAWTVAAIASRVDAGRPVR